MRIAFFRRQAASAVRLIVAFGLSAGAALAAPARIDPDPTSPTLGDLIDRERRQAPRRSELDAASGALRSVSSEAKVAPGSTTVLVPGGRSRPVRVIPIHRAP